MRCYDKSDCKLVRARPTLPHRFPTKPSPVSTIPRWRFLRPMLFSSHRPVSDLEVLHRSNTRKCRYYIWHKYCQAHLHEPDSVEIAPHDCVSVVNRDQNCPDDYRVLQRPSNNRPRTRQANPVTYHSQVPVHSRERLKRMSGRHTDCESNQTRVNPLSRGRGPNSR